MLLSDKKLLSCSTTCWEENVIGRRIEQNLTEPHELNKRDWHFWLKEQKIRHQIPQELFNFTIFTDVLYWVANLLFRNQFLQLGLEILHLQKHNQHHAQTAQSSVTRHKGGRTVLRDRKRSASATIWHHPARWPPAPDSSKHRKRKSQHQAPKNRWISARNTEAPQVSGLPTTRDRSLETAVRPRKKAMAGALGYRTCTDTATISSGHRSWIEPKPQQKNLGNKLSRKQTVRFFLGCV